MATIGETVSGGTAGSVLFVGAGPVLAQDNSNLFWDNSGKKLGIGTTSPLNDLTVRKSDTGTLGIDVINTNTTSGAANAQIFVQVAGPNGGDAVTVYEVVTGARWIVGIDNSDSDKFKFVASTQSVQVCLVMTTDGKIGVTEANPTARLHLPAGTASVAPLKLTSGTNLSSPQDGAVEWDGNKLYITSGTTRRQLAYNEVANVIDFGAKGDGMTDDAPAFQAAADSLAPTGGVILVPPSKRYLIGSKVSIKSNYPIWLVSRMGNRLLGIHGLGSSLGASALIRPKNALTYMFEWARPSGATGFYQVGGGGVDGIAFGDWIDGSTWRQQTIEGALNIDEAPYFTIRDSYFAWLKGRAVRVGRCVIGRVENTWITTSGDTGKSAVDVDGSSLNTSIDRMITGVAKAPDPSTLIWVTAPSHGFTTGNIVYIAFVRGTTEANGVWTITVIDADTFELTESYPPPGTPSQFQNTYVSGGKASKDGIYAALWGESMGMEQCSYASTYIKPTSHGHLWLRDCYFEDVAPADPNDPYVSAVYVDTSAGGGATIQGCSFGSSNNTAIILGAVGSTIRNSSITHFPKANRSIISTKDRVKLENLTISAAGQSGKVIDCTGNFCNLSDLYIVSGGELVATGSGTQLSNIIRINPSASGTEYAIRLGAYSSLTGGLIDMAGGASACHGVLLGAARVTNVMVRGLAQNANGFVCTHSWDTIDSCQVVESVPGGTSVAFTPVAGAKLRNNQGYVETKTSVDIGSDQSEVTLNSECGVITTPSLTTAAGGEHILYIHNSLSTSNSRFHVSVQRAPAPDGNTGGGHKYKVREVLFIAGMLGGADGFAIPIVNDGSGPWNGRIKVSFIIQN